MILGSNQLTFRELQARALIAKYPPDRCIFRVTALLAIAIVVAAVLSAIMLGCVPCGKGMYWGDWPIGTGGSEGSSAEG